MDINNFISHIIEPENLYLAWQPLEEGRSRTRRVVAQLTRRDSEISLQYLKSTLDFQNAVEAGFTCFPAFPNTDSNYREGVLETFMLRLPPRSRHDFPEFLRKFRIKADAIISDFALLGYTEARLPGDGFSIVHPFEDAPSPCELLTEISGFRYYNGVNLNLEFGQELLFEFEKDNPVDRDAISIHAKGQKIGYVNRVQRHAFSLWLMRNNVRAVIEKKNGRPLNPRYLMFVEIS